MRRRGFTLIELLVVIAIIALLISILLPSLGAAKEQANKVKCAASLHGLGQTTTIFAQDHNGHLPAPQLTCWGGPWWLNYIYTKDFIDLKDNYGVPYKVWVCPSKAPASAYYQNIAYGGVYTGDLASFTTAETAAYVRYNSNVFTEAWGSTQDWITGNFPNDYVQTVHYENMFENPVNISHPYGVARAQGTASWDNATAPELAKYNGNPPILADATWAQPDAAGYQWNHGRTFLFSGNADFSAGVLKVDGIQGDVSTNVLFADGHVDNKKPETRGYYQSGANMMALY
jgi:prepilin-type N-terminal cleavage/methylation domain-containing protein/prepilin-type processing-associated H-X9-DG protein